MEEIEVYEPDVEKVFGKKNNKNYKLKRNIFFILLAIVVVILILLARYLEIFKLILTDHFRKPHLRVIELITEIIIISSFYFADKYFKLNFKRRHYFYLIGMIVIGLTFSFVYFRVPIADKLQHFFFPMMVASIFYHLVKKMGIKTNHALLFTFFIVIGWSSLFELFEYYLDVFFDWKMQGVFLRNPAFEGGFKLIQSRIDDTMIDMTLVVCGTLIYTFCTYHIEKFKQRKRRHHTPRHKNSNPTPTTPQLNHH